MCGICKVESHFKTLLNQHKFNLHFIVLLTIWQAYNPNLYQNILCISCQRKKHDLLNKNKTKKRAGLLVYEQYTLPS